MLEPDSVVAQGMAPAVATAVDGDPMVGTALALASAVAVLERAARVDSGWPTANSAAMARRMDRRRDDA